MDENQRNQAETGIGGQTPVSMGANGALEAPPKKKKSGFVIAIIIFAFLLLLGAGAFGMLKYREQQDIDASGEMISAFMKAYGRLHLEKAYELFHPDVRDSVIDEQAEKYRMSGLEGMESYLDLYFGGMELDYEVETSKKLSEEELEDLLSEIDDSYDADLDISKAYVYYVTEVFSGENGTLKVREEYFVGKEEEDWYIIAVTTDKIVKNDVSFSITDYLTEMLEDFMDLYSEAINECDGEKMEEAYSLMHPDMWDVFSEELLRLNSSQDMEEFVERRYALYGGFSVEYEILGINYLEEIEWRPLLIQIENYFETEFDFHLRGVWAFDIEETAWGNNGTTVVQETFFMGEEDGEWCIIDIVTNEILSDTLVNPSQPTFTNASGGGYASAEEAIEQFFHAYENFDLVGAYMTFHPAIRDIALEYACHRNGASDVDEYEEMINDLFGDGLSITYTITQTMELSDDEAEALLSITWNNYGSNVNISDACLYLLEEHGEGSDASHDREELIFAGRDGDQWFLYNSIAIPEDMEFSDYYY